jgi:predicted RNase H-like HicB family nuclease
MIWDTQTRVGSVGEVEIIPIPSADVVTDPSRASGRDFEWFDPKGKLYTCEIRLCPENEGGYSTYAPELPGVVSEGENAVEAVQNMAEALRGALQTYLEDGAGIPWVKTVELPSEGETRLRIEVNV